MIVSRTLFAGILALGAHLTIGADLVWTNLAGGNWNAAVNWSPNQVPASGDNLFITNDGTYTVILNVNATINTLAVGGNIGTQTLSNSAATLTLTNTGSVGPNGVLAMTGGTLTGGGSLTMGGTWIWAGGVVTGPGIRTIAPGGSLSIQGSAAKTLSGGTLVNTATTTWSEGQLNVGSAPGLVCVLSNAPGATLNITADVSFFDDSGGITTFNAGLLRKSAGAGTTTIVNGFNNTGSVEVQSGTLRLTGGGTGTGSHVISAGAVLDFGGGVHNLNSGSTVSGAGTLLVSGATLNFDGTISGPGPVVLSAGTFSPTSPGGITLASLVVGGGTLAGSAAVDVTGPLTWTNGGFNGLGLTHANGGWTIGGTATKTIRGRTLVNMATATWSEGQISVGSSAGSISILSNAPGATFDVAADVSFIDGSGGITTFNAGVLRKSGGIGTSTLNDNFHNTGTVEIHSGTLQFVNPSSGIHSGDFVVSPGAALEYAGASHTLTNGGSITGGALVINSGLLTVNAGGEVVVTNLTVNGGTLSGTGPVTASGLMTWTGGTLSGTGTLHANGGLVITGAATKTVSTRTLVNTAVAAWSGGSISVGLGAVISNAPGATFDITFDGSYINGGGANTTLNAGLWRKTAGGGTTEFSETFHNTGTVEIQSGAMVFDGTYTQTAGQTLLHGGNITNTLALRIHGGVLAGTNIIAGSVTNRATVSPGASPGQLTITGDYTQTTNATLAIEIAGIQPGTQHDQLVVGGIARLAGTLIVTNTEGFLPKANELFTILTAGNRSGAFTNVAFTSSIYQLQTSYTPTQAVVQFIPPALAIAPDTASIIPGETQLFAAVGGVAPFIFSLSVNNSGGSVDPTNGLYTAGGTIGAVDLVRVTDALGSIAEANVTVAEPRPHLVFMSVPNNQAALLDFSPKVMVMVQDHFGSVVPTTNAITLSLGSNPSGDTLQGTITVTAVNGMAEFDDVWLNREGIGYTLVASATGVISGTSLPFNVLSPSFRITSQDDSGEGSLRRLITGANHQSGDEIITIFADAPRSLTLQTPLPPLTRPIRIQGLNGPFGEKLVKLDGRLLTTGTAGLVLEGPGCVIRDLVLIRFPGNAITIVSSNAVVEGCHLGLDGFSAAHNLGFGIAALGNKIAIGSTNLAGRNVFCANSSGGILISGSGSRVFGNLIGIDPTENTEGNGGPGILLSNATHCLIGGESPEFRNHISWNVGPGIEFTGAGCETNVVVGNFIGTGIQGSTSFGDHGNVGDGILVDGGASDIFIGATNLLPLASTNLANIIAFNQGAGVRVANGSSVLIRGNNICRNQQLGIQLGAGNEPPDIGDNDTGPNGFQNSPEPLRLIGPGSSPIIRGELRSKAHSTYVLDCYALDSCNLHQTHVHSQSLTADASGIGIADTTDFRKFSGWNIIVTATDSQGNTSEFSPCPASVITRVGGNVVDHQGQGLAGADITITGAQNGSAQSDATGAYELFLPQDSSSYVLTPSKPGYTFTPPFQGLITSSTNEQHDFFAHLATPVITVMVLETNGTPIANVQITVTLTNGDLVTGATTDGTGTFPFSLPALGDYLINAAHPQYTFNPPTHLLSNLISDQVVQFTGGRIDSRVAGQVRDASGVGLGSVSLTLQTSGQRSRRGLTSGNGDYQFTGLVPGTAYVVTPVSGTARFEPPSMSFTAGTGTETVNFTGFSAATISGRVTNSAGTGFGNTVILIDDAASGTNVAATSTLGTGDFTSPLLVAGRSYRVRPALPGVIFTPATRTTGPLASNVTGVDFTGTNSLLSISGLITNSRGFRLNSGTVVVTGGTNRTGAVSVSGNYSVAGLASLQNYTITPSRSNFTFTPPQVAIPSLTSNVTLNFVCSPAYPLPGRIAFRNGMALHVMNADATDSTMLGAVFPLSGSPEVFGPSYSPDGGRIAHTGATAGGTGIYLINSGGGPRVLLTGTNETARDPGWSPDGRWVVYALLSSAQGRTPGLWIRDSISGTEFRIPNTRAGDYQPDFAPDGQSVVFTGLPFLSHVGSRDIYAINTNGSNRTPILIGGHRITPKWSPAGDRFAFASPQANSWEIYLYEMSSHNTTRLTTNGLTDWNADWSPDGSNIVFETVDGGQPRIAVMKADGSGRTILATGVHPSWSVTPTIATPVGSPVTVTSAVTSVTFSDVTGSGTTTVQPVPPNLQFIAPPGYFTIPGANMGFEISTTVSNTGPIILCFTLPATMSSNAFQLARVLHVENGVAVDRTILSGPNAPNFTNKTLCAEVTSLSPFLLAMLADPQLATIQGVAVDSSGSPIPDVLVELDGPEALSLLTGIDGSFAFVNLTPGSNFTLMASHSGITFSPPVAVVDGLTGTNTLAFVGQVDTGPILIIEQHPLVLGQVRLAWPQVPEGFVLEYTTNLAAASWTVAPGIPIATNGQYQLSLPVEPTMRFFRLRK